MTDEQRKMPTTTIFVIVCTVRPFEGFYRMRA
jgi:hypothetical protein